MKKLLTACLVTACMAAPATATQTFRQFVQIDPGAKPFEYFLNDLDPSIDALSTLTGTYDLALSTPKHGVPPFFFPVTVTIEAYSDGPLLQMTPTVFSMPGWYGHILLTTMDPSANPTLLKVAFEGAVVSFDGEGGNWASIMELGGVRCNPGSGFSICYQTDYLPQKWIEASNANNFALSFSAGDAIEGPYSGTGTFAATIPEAGTWAMLITGFGLVGFAARRRRVGAAA